MIKRMSNQNPYFSDLLRIYWAIAWRANVFGAMIITILFCLCPFLLHLLLYVGKLEEVREYIFLSFPFSSLEENPNFSPFQMTLYCGLGNFMWDYLIFYHGFRRVLQQNIFQHFFDEAPSSLTYSTIFLIPLLLYHLLEPLLILFSGGNSSDNPIIIMIVSLIIYFMTVFTLLKKTIQKERKIN